jgi:uncharacterized DUF497 family protein
MDDGEFSWDDNKAVSNLIKHGVSFEMAREIFKDVFALDVVDDRFDYGEIRYNLYGMIEGHILFVVYTMRGDIIRIITARRAEPHERKRYHEENSH